MRGTQRLHPAGRLAHPGLSRSRRARGRPLQGSSRSRPSAFRYRKTQRATSTTGSCRPPLALNEQERDAVNIHKLPRPSFV